MKETRILMGMPVTVEVVASDTVQSEVSATIKAVYDYFTYIDEKFSTYKPESEISKINRGEIADDAQSDDMKIIFMLAEETKQRTDGFFDIRKPDGSRDPSGIVKGWAIWNTAKLIEVRGFKNFYVDAGGDIETRGVDERGKQWTVGIRNPLTHGTPRQNEIVKTIYAPKSGIGIATSGTYIRGKHIYNPKNGAAADEMVSLTVIGPNIYEADRFATAAFAMGKTGIHFIEKIPGLEGYMIDEKGIATMTTGFETYTHELHR